MKERPILFSGPMVRAVLDGRKSQTRRVVTDRHLTRLGLEIHDGIAFTLEGGQWNGMFESGSPPWCPYGIPGDRLWVRETWRFADEDVVGFRADDSHGEQSERVRVLAERYWHRPSGFAPLHWLPSIYMPRWASRITLEVVAVRVERLQDITADDAKSEGVEVCKHFADANKGHPLDPHRVAFAWLWNTINGSDAWIANPWVWVVEFKRLEQPK